VAWSAKRRYTYVALSTRLEPTLDLWNLYVKTAAEEGYQAGPENFVYMQPVFCAETEAQAEDFGRRFLYGGGFAFFGRSEWMFPPGYNSKAATRRMAELANQRTNIWGGAEGESGQGANETKIDGDLQMAMGRDPRNDAEVELVKKAIYAQYPELLKSRQMIAGPRAAARRFDHADRRTDDARGAPLVHQAAGRRGRAGAARVRRRAGPGRSVHAQARDASSRSRRQTRSGRRRKRAARSLHVLA